MDATLTAGPLLVGLPVREPGVYFGLDEAEYHADPSLGSTDVRRLRHTPADWWWHSAYNVHRPKDDEDDKQAVKRGDGKAVGTAIHHYVLHGPESFHAAYRCRPDHIDRLTDARARMLAPGGQKLLWEEDYTRTVIATRMIIANPALEQSFLGGAPEVSVFWRQPFEGRMVPCKARFDYLKLRAVVDLKSIRNSRELPFPEACRRRIAEARYDMQAAHYCRARRQLPALVEAGRVYGLENDRAGGHIASDAPPTSAAGAVSLEWLKQAAARDAFAFVFVFFAADGAPLTWACSLSPANPILASAEAHVDQGLAQYVACAERFGFDAAWLPVDEIAELDVHDLPAWTWK